MTNLSASSKNRTEVVIAGAGPYGLSVAAHLAAAGVPFRIFGKPMSAWADQMPKGMHLKSEGFASSLSDPGATFTLAEFCRQNGLAHQENDRPVELETFVAYGLEFQRRFVPNLENRMIAGIERSADGFQVTLEDGEVLLCKKVVLALGITRFANVPQELNGLPISMVSHSSAHHNLEHFKGKRVAVIGAGSSAIDLAALLHRAGATCEVISRRSAIKFHKAPRKRSLRERISSPMTGIGMGWDLFFYAKAPHLFRHLPESLRLDRVRKTLGPAPGWFVRDQVMGKVQLTLNAQVTGARAADGGVTLDIDQGGSRRSAQFDHVIAATGYRVDVDQLQILSQELRANITLTGKAPKLSAYFESSVPGLFFVGVASANSFGPVMRFVVGTEFAAPRIASHLARTTSRIQSAPNRSKDAQTFERSYSDAASTVQK